LPGNPAVTFCGKFFANLGAKVIRVTQSGADPWPPSPSPEAYHLFLDIDKEQVELDLGSESGREEITRLIDQADVFLTDRIPESLRKAGILTERGSLRRPELILSLLTQFGHEGPYSDFKG